MHLDIAGVSGVVDGADVPYLAKGIAFQLLGLWFNLIVFFVVAGMTGRPTRTLIEVLSRISQNKDLQTLF